MANCQDRANHHKMRKILIEEQGRLCAVCGATTNLEIHRIIHGNKGGQYIEANCQVLCHKHHKPHHPLSKFHEGETVIVNGRSPDFIELERGRPRTVIAVRYDSQKQCNFYLLGSNGRGIHTLNGNPQLGFNEYWFRSYQLVRYEPRAYARHNEQISSEQRESTVRAALNNIYAELNKVA